MTLKINNQFVAAAKRFIDWADAPWGESDHEARRALELVTDLLLCALRLKQPGFEGDYEPPATDDSIWEFQFKKCRLLPFNYYSIVLEPLETPPKDAGIGDLADDLVSIYCDVLAGMTLYNAGQREAAFYHWKLLFSTHWQHHATDAIFALGRYLQYHPDL